jgi:hypothetical protein
MRENAAEFGDKSRPLGVCQAESIVRAMGGAVLSSSGRNLPNTACSRSQIDIRMNFVG